jgi:hypothetical protein
MENLNKPSYILGGALLLSALIFSLAFYSARSSDDSTLQVTGSAKVSVTSDSVKWRFNISRLASADGLKDGYRQLDKDLGIVKGFFKKNGIEEDQLTVSPISMYENYKPDYYAPKDYNLSQNIELQSTDIEKITALAKNIQPLIDAGLLFTTSSLEYYYLKLPEVRISLMGEAVKDARARAEVIAESSGRKVGDLKSASMGVVQVLPVNSVDVSDYGSYDTTVIEKEVMVTVKASFSLR